MPRDSGLAIDPDELMLAYRLGYFPMARRRDDKDVMWVLPETRGAAPIGETRVPSRLQRFVKTTPFDVRVNADFRAVMEACAAPAPGREDTWINDAILETYCELHFRGLAHSVECYRNGALVGGLYGVAIGGVFCGESMFSRMDNASKTAMVHLIARLRIGGFALLDAQFPTSHLAQFGVREMSNAEYQLRLAASLDLRADFLKAPLQLSTATVLQSITQTS